MNKLIVWRSVFGIILFMLVLEKAQARGRLINCYACEGKKGERCGDEFHPAGIRVMNCTGSCVKTNNKFKSQVTYSRYCSNENMTDGCKTTTYDTGPHIKCVCSTNYCNSGNLLAPSNLIVLLQMLPVCIAAIPKLWL